MWRDGPPASTPWTTSASTPARSAVRASPGAVTVAHTAAPAACSRSTTAGSGQPNVTETTGTRSSATSPSFSSQPSSSWRGAPGSP